jgi:hypothetical protein
VRSHQSKIAASHKFDMARLSYPIGEEGGILLVEMIVYLPPLRLEGGGGQHPVGGYGARAKENLSL